MEGGVNPMVELLKSIGYVATAIFGFVGNIASTITGTPLLLLTVGFLVVGGAIGIFGRLLSRN